MWDGVEIGGENKPGCVGEVETYLGRLGRVVEEDQFVPLFMGVL